jgi:ribose transport system substrate-binding protein
MRNINRLAKWGTATAVIAMIAGLTSCGPSEPAPQPEDMAAPSQDAPPSPPTVALIMKSLANEFFKTMEDGARAHNAENPDAYELIAQGIKDEIDVNRQIQLVEQMTARPVDAIVIAPADSKALVGVCKKAMDAGIVVINIDNKFDDAVLADKGVKIPFVGPDNRKGAKLVGDELAKKLQPGDPVAIIEGVPTAFNAIQRKLGFEDAMKAGGMKVVASQSARWEMAEANKVVSPLVASHPDLKALLCANDSMALGAVAALKQAGKTGEILVVGYDNISAVQELVKEGTVLATADQHAGQLAVFGIEYALEMLNTGAAPEDRETPVDLVTAKDLQ